MGKKMRKMAAFAMAAAMAVSTPVGAAGSGSSGTVFSGANATSGTSSHVFYRQNITTVVVPTALTVAFNPEGFNVDLGNGEIVDDQVVSKSVAMVSEAIDDHKVGVSFAIKATGDKLKFVTDPSKVNEGKDHNVLLQLQVAGKDDTISVYSAAGSATDTKSVSVSSGVLTVTPAQLSRAVMSGAASGTSGVVALTSGAKANFLLGKANYDYKTIVLDGYSGTNVISGTLESIGVSSAASGSAKEDWTYTGLTGFKFTGMLNKYAKWYEIGANDTISIVPTYSFEELKVDSNNLVDEKVLSGTGAFLGLEGAGTASSTSTTAADPTISSITDFTKASPSDVVISFTLGSGNKAVEADGVKLLQGSSDTAVNTAKYTVNMTAKTVTIDKTAGFMTGATANIPVKVVLTKNGEDVKTLSGTITVK